VLRFHESSLFVSVADAAEVGADDLEVAVEAGVVGSHFEHAQVQEGEGGEGAAGDEHEGSAGGGFDAAAQAGGGEFVFGEGHVAADVVGHGGWWRPGVGGVEGLD